jgi:hypothetical protein
MNNVRMHSEQYHAQLMSLPLWGFFFCFFFLTDIYVVQSGLELVILLASRVLELQACAITSGLS